MNVLLVDDEYQILEGLMNGVQWDVLNFENVYTAKSYAQTMETMEKQKIEIVVSDIEMSDKSGLELIAEINKKYPDTECIILSCHDEFDYARKAVSLKCFEYLLKPVPYDVLTGVLKRAAEEVRNRNGHSLLENYGRIYVKQMETTGNTEDENMLCKVQIGRAHV